ncbi:hypothetical protein BDV95DRAFT_500870 [Massariosphaeria phaeospora]|uniref:Caib baif family enzyme n=1 Tax=Massariosphaeria phaeospora TaxID=100035 RepID=A0A7C8I9A3_9PLEO|nr:hypothetical protein BDV95DRAFT_500870 [Massariosphaeria phaeospora]
MTKSQPHDDLEPVCNIVTPVGMLGYGLKEEQTADALERLLPNGAPTAIILDSGSTDSGPEKLALGKMSLPRSSYVKDLTKLLRLAVRFGVPLLFSSAGGDGSDEHVRELVGVIEEIAAMEGNEHYKLKTIALFSGIDKSLVLERLRAGAISGCGKPVPALTEDDIALAPRIVAQMGPEPFIDAMKANPDFNVIVGGRAYDPSPYVAFAAFARRKQLEGKDTALPESQKMWGALTHFGKLMECGGQCATPKSHGASVCLYADGTFDISPSEPTARCTPITVAAHTLYEKTRPDILSGPGGYLDLTASTYEQLEDGRTCRVRGGLFKFSRDLGKPYQVKLEGASIAGYRSMYMGSLKDPILINELDGFLEQVKLYATTQHEGNEGEWELDFHVYGENQVSALPESAGQPSEIFLIGEALATTQALATSIVSTARVATIHGSYPGQKATSGNFAYGHGGKLEVELGPCAQFSIYHLMDLNEGEERLRIDGNDTSLFSQDISIIGRGEERKRSSNGVIPPPNSATKPAVKRSLYDWTSRSSKKRPRSEQDLPAVLGDVARILRSKNAGPFEITFDVMFDRKEIYELVKNSNILNSTAVAKLVGVQEEDIVWCGFYDQALGFKVTIPRLRRNKPVASGGFMENDVQASQKYIGLLNMKLPDIFVQSWKELSEHC